MSLTETEWPSTSIALITLNDPTRRNALTRAMGASLADSLRTATDVPHLRAVVIAGAPPAFSAGGDLEMIKSQQRKALDGDPDLPRELFRFYDAFLAVGRLDVPVIAAINGHAIGAGLAMALACDLRLVASEARLGLTFTRMGLHPGMASTWLLPRLVGPQRAAELLYTGRTISGTEATAMGLTIGDVPRDNVVSSALELARDIAEAGPVAVRLTKRALAASSTQDLMAQMELEADHQTACLRTNDFARGLAAVEARETPTFRGA